MKTGDKVFEFDNTAHEIIEGVCLDIIKNKRRTYITVGYTTKNGAMVRGGGRILGFDIFPTREALCEHYRKIFE